jgi:hypothetical protein
MADNPFLKLREETAAARKAVNVPPISLKKAGDPGYNEFRELMGYNDEALIKPTADQEYATKLNKAFKQMPWYKQGAVAADDTARVFASGITLGALDDRLGPEHAQAVKDARIRSGLAGQGADIAGMVASPVTRVVGNVAKAIKPAGKGLMKMLARAGVDVGEGAALSGSAALVGGRPEQALEEAQTGGIINAIVPRAFQAVGKIGKFGSGLLTGADPAKFTQAFEAGKTKATSEAFRLGQQGKPSVASDAFRAAEQKFRTGFQNLDNLKQTKADIKAKYVTPGGRFSGTPTEKNAYNAMMKAVEKPTGITSKEAEAVRRSLGGYARHESPVIKDMATTLQESLVQTASKNQPGYTSALDKLLKADEAYSAGKGLTRKLPDKMISSILAAGIPATIGASALLGSPLGLLATLALPASSPRLAGFIANKAGKTAENLAQAGLTKSNVGVLPYIQSQRAADQRKKNRK